MPAPTSTDSRSPRSAVSASGVRQADRPRVVHSRPEVRRPHAGLPAVIGIAIVAAVLLPLIVFGGAYTYVSSESSVTQPQQTDAIVVLGAAQFDGKPSPVLKARLSHALDLFRAGTAPRIITVGGKQTGDRFTEAGVGREWLISHGVPASAVFAARDGSNTRESLVSVAELAAAKGWSSITLDSDPAHMARSRAIANRLGFDVHTNPTQNGDGSQATSEYLFRETLAYLAFESRDQWDVPRIIQR